MSSGEPPQVRKDVNLLAPSQNPQDPKPVLAPEGPVIPHPRVRAHLIQQSTREQARQETRDRNLLMSLRRWSKADPDLAAEAEQLSIDLEVGAEIAESNMESAREIMRAREFSAFVQTSGNPVLMEMLLHPQFAKIAHNDLENLERAGETSRQWAAGRLGDEQSRIHFRRMMNRGILSKEDARRLEEIDELQSVLPQDVLGEDYGLSIPWYGAVKMVGGIWSTLGHSLDTGLAAAGGALLLGQLGPQVGLPEEIVTVPTAFIYGSLVGLGTSAGAQIGGEAYGGMRDLGIEHDEAFGPSLTAGIIGGALEASALRLFGGKIAVTAMQNFVARKAATEALTRKTKSRIVAELTRDWLKGSGAEIGVELTQEIAQWYATDYAIAQTKDKSQLKLDQRGDLLDNLEHTFWETLAGVALLSSFGPGVQLINNTRKVRASVQFEEQLTEFSEVVNESKVVKHSPNRFLDYLLQTGEAAGGPREVLFDIKQFRISMTEAGFTDRELAEKHPEVAEALKQAEADGLGDVAISTAGYGAKFLPTDFGRALIPHARTEPGGMTAAEGVMLQDMPETQLAEVGKKLLEAEKVTEQFREEVAAIKKQRFAQLVEAGRPPREARVAANIRAHVIAAFADKAGITPKEAAVSYFGQVVDEDVSGVDALEQPSSPEFVTWFDDSKVVDEQGAPLVVYHGTSGEGIGEAFDEGRPAFFTDNPDAAAQYSGVSFFRGKPERVPEGARTVPAYLSLQNPLIVEMEGEHVGTQRTRAIARAKKEGRDGVIFRGGEDVPASADPYGTLPPVFGDVYVAFDPTQIKSTQNRGEFDPDKPGILEQEQRGKFVPSTRETILSKDADASTVMHELLHEYVNALLMVAGQENAPQAILDEIDTLLRYWKIKGETVQERLANWNSMSFEEQAPHQESVSYNYELWLFNGTAPTEGLRRLFGRIRDFMVSVYTSLVKAQRQLSARYRSNFGADLPGMTSELQEMFERMVASEQAAQKIEAVREWARLFESKEDFVAAGNKAEQWEGYLQNDEDSRQKLKTELTGNSLRAMRWQARARGRVLKAMQQENRERRKKVKEDVTVQVEAEPIYQIIDYLKSEKTGLDREAVLNMLGDVDEQTKTEVVKKLGRLARAKEGQDPHAIAEFFPDVFPSGQALVAAMIAAPKIKDAIEIRTDQEMQRRFGDPMSAEEAEDRVERAVHNEARARFVAAELKFLEGATKPVAVMIAAARAAAHRILAKRQLNDISPHTFAMLEARERAAAHRAMKPVAPRKASADGKRAEVVARGPDLDAAIDAKQRELLYNQLARLALEARTEVRKATAGTFRRMARHTNEDLSKSRNVDFAQVARAILGMHGLLPEGVAAETSDYIALMQKDRPEVFAQFEDTLAEAQTVAAEVGHDHRNMTLDQFRTMREEVEALWHFSKRENEIEVEGKRLQIASIIAEMKPVLDARARKEIPGQTGAVSKGAGASIMETANLSRTALTKLQHYLRELDGGKQGPFTKFLYREVKEALNDYRADAVIYTKQLVDMLKELRGSNLLDKGPIEWRDENGNLIYRFGQKGSRVGGMTELLGALQHMGNESNRSKLLVAGRGRDTTRWADVIRDKDGKVVDIDYSRWDAFIAQKVADGTLKQAHFDFTQGVWDLMEEIKPLLQKAHIKLKGYAFKEVKAQPFEITFPDGTTKTYRGGYVPAGIDYDAAREVGISSPVEVTLDQMRDGFYHGLAKVESGMTMERVENYRERPLTMKLDQIFAHIDKAMRYAHVEPVADDMRRLITNPEFKAAMTAVDPNAIDGIFLPFLDRAVTQTLYKSPDTPAAKAANKFWKYFRRMVGVRIMSGNFSVAFQQYTGMSNALNYVKARYMKAGVAAMLRNPVGLARRISEQSKFMADRLKHQAFDLSEDFRKLTLSQGTFDQLQAKGIKWGYILPALAQNMVDTATWQGAYEQAIENATESETIFQMEQRAVREADEAVVLSQGSFSPEDVAGYDKGSAFYRTWTQFTNYFSTVLNQVYYAPGGKEKVKAALLGFAVPAMIAQAITMTLYDRWDDEDDDGHLDPAVWRELFLWSTVSSAAAMVPGFGSNLMSIAAQAGWTDRPAFGDRVVPSPTVSNLMQSAVGMARAFDDLFVEGELPTTRTARDAFSLLVVLVPGGAAVAPFIRSATYATGIARGETEPTSAADVLRGLMSGHASKDSQNR